MQYEKHRHAFDNDYDTKTQADAAVSYFEVKGFEVERTGDLSVSCFYKAE